MGSSGYGRFGDYPGSSSFGSYGGTGNQGNSSEYNRELDCPVAIDLIILEDVATSEYYSTRHRLPSPGEDVELKDCLHEGRLVVISSSTGEIIGNLPTEYNYLLDCLTKGYLYEGEVSGSFETPVPSVYIAATPQKV